MDIILSQIALQEASLGGPDAVAWRLSFLEGNRIGVTLSEEFQIEPEQSTSAIIVHHPQAKYFTLD